MGKIFGTDGVRDRAGSGPLAPDRVAALAAAAGTLLRRDPALFAAPLPEAFRALGAPGPDPFGAGKVLVGRDTRASGPAIEEALVEGFRAAGVDVLRAGVLPTPGVACLTRLWGCALGVVISASHNPAEDNGIKFISPQGFKIPDAAEAAIEALLEDPAFRPPAPPRPGTAEDLSARAEDYPEFLARFLPRSLRGVTIAVDCAHGAASAFARPLLERLGARVLLTGASPDGSNINAGVGALHPERVAELVRRERADLGVAFDGDADRAIFADETGAVRDGETVLALCGADLRRKGRLPGDRVVSTVMANYGLERHLAAHGIRLLRTKVGDRFVAEEMLRSGAVLGGEPSGHVLFFDASPAGDGLLTTLRVLGVLAERGEPLSRAAFEKFPQALLNVPVRRKPPLDEVPALERAVEAARRELGPDGRVLVRYSGTEPLCRVMVEGPDAGRVERLAAELAETVRRELA
jgi:phosphoglucosamine mutase